MTPTMTMEAWLAELEMEMDPNSPSLIKELYQQSETMEPSFEEQLAATLGSDFPYRTINTMNDDMASPEGDFDGIIDQYLSTPHISEINNNNNDNNNNDNDNDNENIVTTVQKSQPSKNKKERKKQAEGAGSKRKRQPGQVQDHIIAERKRRELLSHMMISLSAMIPGLKKIDKITVLGAAIKQMKELQEKVKVLENMLEKKTVESQVVVKKSKLKADNGSRSNDNASSSTVEDYCGGSDDGDGDGGRDTLPEIHVKVMEKTLLLRVCCEKQKGIFVKLFLEAEKHGLSITNFNVAPLNDVALNITIVAQMQMGYNKYVRDLVRTLHNVLHLAN